MGGKVRYFQKCSLLLQFYVPGGTQTPQEENLSPSGQTASLHRHKVFSNNLTLFVLSATTAEK